MLVKLAGLLACFCSRLGLVVVLHLQLVLGLVAVLPLQLVLGLVAVLPLQLVLGLDASMLMVPTTPGVLDVLGCLMD